MNTKEIRSVLRHEYEIKEPSIIPLEGYDSINFKIIASGHVYVLKVYENQSQNVHSINVENEVLSLLNEQGIKSSKPVPTLTGSLFCWTDKWIYRLLTYLDGNFLAESHHTKELYNSFGTMLAKLDNCLATYEHPQIKAKVTQWDLKHFQKNWKYLEEITIARHRSLVYYYCVQYKEHVMPLQYELRQSCIHNDANDWNILVNNDHISGIIDFGDMCHSWLINELVIGLTYILMNKEHPLQVASTVIKAYHKILPLEEREIDIIYYLIAARLCTSVLNSAHTKKQKPDSAYITISEKAAWKLLHKWITINPLLAKNVFRNACGFEKNKTKPLQTQLERRKNNLSDALSLSYTKPIQMYGAAFQYMYDTDGNTFLDAYNNIIQVGHCHPDVVRAGQLAMGKLNTNTRYIYDELLSYTDKLLNKFPPELNKVFLVNSGSAASDLAIRLAKTHTKKHKTLVLEHGYHGNTQNAIEISHYKYHHKGGNGRQENVLQTMLPKLFNVKLGNDKKAAAYYIADAIQIINENKGQIAAFIAEPIVGCGGQVPLPQYYLMEVYKGIRQQGGVCISDEVQVGFGRLGKYFWGYQMYDVIPDIVVLGKPIGNGHPMAAVVTTTEIAQSFDNGMEFFSSFGGNPVSCAIGEAVLHVLDNEDLPENAHKVGQYLKNGLKKLKVEFPELADIRGEGLFLGVELLDHKNLPNTVLAKKIKNELREKHILISTDGPYDNVLKIKPPLYFTKENANLLLSELRIILENQKKIDTFKVYN
ncbi:hydroxylysine kinase /5-phosphonooxy-L-lysine phospho-lyase apoenzyme [Maribacter sedimenticola]|uniref:Hydroxylysine kinase /5-phosphonooxy-L-lysine phospho-lyase apoenzyme n=1 Tax=Maribacter sedimenticola TaxID=228956 RepID=A0ABY1SK74_9FLAO|nr:aminotransferase class III-fold pyridoxal phosphate-dependent enzyme [Maribacter sedimenticola]SNR63650.1 hydroxylysine kinase /5-phosphonooxy-L-lysine phospho-lyase apoenzyme [Maribacter sedimenticola]